MIKKVFVIFLFSSLILMACSKTKVMNFTGESENWYVDYEVKVFDENSESTHFTIKYKGKDPKPQKIKYNIEYGSGKTDGTDNLNNGELNLGGHSCSGCAVIQEDDVMEVTITWNGELETFNLKNK
ncbi:hypothetical protein ACFVSW_26325 [Neobacillus sp. NPDC058068]|uniref:hypothetical protein n=1 Tax=Neobacillus sp. NPDC058068 TaxID=3346325 RepID=UPI0036DF93A0